MLPPRSFTACSSLPPEGAAAPAVWQSQSRGPCWWRGDFSTLVTSLAAEGAAGTALTGKHLAKSSKLKVTSNVQPRRWSSPSKQGQRTTHSGERGSIITAPLPAAANHTKWRAQGLFLRPAGAAGLALPDRRRSGPLGGQGATRSERPWGPS